MSRLLGAKGEKLGKEFLLSIGHQIVTTNFYSHFGEIDIITCKDKIYHFIEVKYSQKYDPSERITPKKLVKIFRTVEFYMYKEKIENLYQIDALFIWDNSFEFVENIS